MRKCLDPHPPGWKGPGRPRTRPDIEEGGVYWNSANAAKVLRKVLSIYTSNGRVPALKVKYEVLTGVLAETTGVVNYESFYAWAKKQATPDEVEAAKFRPVLTEPSWPDAPVRAPDPRPRGRALGFKSDGLRLRVEAILED